MKWITQQEMYHVFLWCIRVYYQRLWSDYWLKGSSFLSNPLSCSRLLTCIDKSCKLLIVQEVARKVILTLIMIQKLSKLCPIMMIFQQLLKPQHLSSLLSPVVYYLECCRCFLVYSSFYYVEHLPLLNGCGGRWRSEDPSGSRRRCMEGLLWWGAAGHCGWICHALRHRVHIPGNDVSSV